MVLVPEGRLLGEVGTQCRWRLMKGGSEGGQGKQVMGKRFPGQGTAGTKALRQESAVVRCRRRKTGCRGQSREVRSGRDAAWEARRSGSRRPRNTQGVLCEMVVLATLGSRVSPCPKAQPSNWDSHTLAETLRWGGGAGGPSRCMRGAPCPAASRKQLQRPQPPPRGAR